MKRSSHATATAGVATHSSSDESSQEVDGASSYTEWSEDGGGLFFCGNVCLPSKRPRSGQPNPPPASKSKDIDQNARNQLESMLAKEMTKISLDERTHAMEDMHGVAAPSALVAASAEQQQRLNDGSSVASTGTPIVDEFSMLKQLEEALQEAVQKNFRNHSSSKANAYEQARFLNPSYVQSDLFLLPFLRMTDYDIPDTVKRVLFHFQLKQDLFGYDLLAKRLLLKDLDPVTRHCVEHGSMHIFSTLRDSVGRYIIWDNYRLWDYPNLAVQVKALWYMAMSLFERNAIANPRSSAVLVLHAIGATASHFLQATGMGTKYDLPNALPVKISAVHFCMGSTHLGSAAALAWNQHQKQARIRTKFHFGSHLEVMYLLASYGISQHSGLPLDLDGNVNEDLRRQRVQEQLQYEEELERTAGSFILPKSTDVLLGKGKCYQNHPGNREWRSALAAAAPEYHSIPLKEKKKKSIFSAALVDELRVNMRFLVRVDDSRWQLADDEVIRKAVTMKFRNLSRNEK